MIITKQLIKKLLNKNIPSGNLCRHTKSKYPHIYSKIVEQTIFLNKFETEKSPISFKERIYCILNDLNDRPKCKNCNTHYVCGFNKLLNEYKKWCSPQCQASDKECIQKSKQTRKDKYGDENFSNTEQSRKTRYKNNNGRWHSNDYADKVKNTKNKNYGNANYVNSAKAKKTIKKLVEQNPDYWKDRELKTKATKIANGHDPNWNNRQQYYDTCNERYGVSCYTQSDDFAVKLHLTLSSSVLNNPEYYKDIVQKRNLTINEIPNFYENRKKKIILTVNERYGVDYVLQLSSVRERKKYITDTRIYFNFLSCEYDRPVFSFDEYVKFKYDIAHKFTFKCCKCEKTFTSPISDGRNHLHCSKCFPIPKSKSEEEIIDFCKLFYDGDIIHRFGSRKVIAPFELDIYFPSKNLAIEYDGLFWHKDSENKPSTYHLRKTDMCEAKGIQLIHIFENEWQFKKNIVKSRIKNLFGVFDTTVYARLCTVKEVDSKTSTEFLNENHLQGSSVAKHNIGLFYKDLLISLMTFGKPRFNKKYLWELVRFCNKLGYHIPGAAGKLLKYFENKYKPTSLISYADRRWSQGKLYKALGFTLDHVSKPDYWYFMKTDINLQHRSKFLKHKLKNLLPNFDPKLSEWENMKANKYFKIYDCGNYVFIKTYKA